MTNINNFIADREGDPPPVDSPSSNTKPVTIDYQPPKNVYSFPPNIDSLYPPPGDTRKPISVSSYLPPASGPTNYPIYPGPVMSKPVSTLNTQVDNSGSMDSGMNTDDSSSNMDDNGSMKSENSDRPSDDMKLIDKPPSKSKPDSNKKPEFPALSFLNQDSNDDHDHNHDHIHDHDHDHHYHHHSHDDHFHDHDTFSPYDDSLKHLHGFEAFPGKFCSSFFVTSINFIFGNHIHLYFL